MTVSTDTITDKIQYCVDTIVKETPKEERLVKQILYAMLSAYSNRPINLAINAPSGEGKNYILNKVAEMFPQNDVVSLAGMTDKALFHRNGKLVIKNEQSGEYEPLDDMLAVLDDQIQDKQSDILSSNNKDLKVALQHQIRDLENEKKELIKDAKKLIDLSHSILIFLDSPRTELLSGIMPLLSHDKYEVEYEYTDTNNGIKTRTNILRGWPAVIFAQAIDRSHNERFPEIKRRFIFVNPKMDKEKYDAAINLMCDKYSLPDFAYQAKIVSRKQKNEVKSIIRNMADGMIEISKRTEVDKNNVLIPYINSINKSLSRDQAFDMTTAKRLLTYLEVLPLINFESRPRIENTDPNNPLFIDVSYIATFEDLKEAIYLMEYGSGARPYIMEWYDEVYLPTYAKLTEPNSRVDSNGRILQERMIGLNIRQLVDATLEIQNRALTDNQIRDKYLKPLLNENFINICNSECDRRSYISFPLINSGKIGNYTLNEKVCNWNNVGGLKVIDFTTFPSKQYLNIWFSIVGKYTLQTSLKNKIISHENKELSIDELVDQYYSNPENYFESHPTTIPSTLPPYYSENAYPVRVASSSSTTTILTTNNEGPIICPKCAETIDPFYKWIHESNCEGYLVTK